MARIMNSTTKIKIALLFLILAVQGNFSWGQIRLPKLISDGAILQRDTDLKIWGWASPNEAIELQFQNNLYATSANGDGEWDIMIPSQKAGGPYEMSFKGKNEITLKNILVGEVWICSGQSNMELTMKRLRDRYPEEIKNSTNSEIRQFLVPDKYDFNKTHTDLPDGSWKEASPETLLEFSGVAYFFAKELYKKNKVPIGLINAAMGGSPVEAWMSEDALKPFPEAYDEMQKFKNKDLINEIEQNDKKRQKDWYAKLNEKDAGFVKGSEWFLNSTNDSQWATMNVPGFWADEGLAETNGVVWFRKTIEIGQNMVGKKAKIWLGRIVDQDHVYVNGAFVGTTGYQYPPRKYHVPEAILKSGKNTIAVRLINEQGKGGFILDKPYFMAVEKDTVDLKGVWKYKLGTQMDPLKSQTFIRWKPGGLYNHMIAPLLNYRIKGVIWYQGESNASRPKSYNETFPALINNWRNKWKLGNFPFLYVQLANFMEETTTPTESNWAELRQAQLNTLKVSNTGMVVTTDLGEWNDIHPLNKKDVGKRLANQAFKLAYDMAKVAVSPIPSKYKFSRKKVKITFDYVSSGLISNNNQPLSTFEISKDGKTFFEAKAIIIGNEVIVWHNEINRPKSVRYAWSNNPIKANLFSTEGLPVSPFEIIKPNPR